MAEPRGFGGWLVVAAIECLVTAGVSAFTLFATLNDGSAGAGLLLIQGASIALNVLAAAFAVVEGRRFPQIFAAALALQIAKNAVDLLAPRADLKLLATDTTALLTAIAVALAWMFYLRKSVRVRNTFPPLWPVGPRTSG